MLSMPNKPQSQDSLLCLFLTYKANTIDAVAWAIYSHKNGR